LAQSRRQWSNVANLRLCSRHYRSQPLHNPSHRHYSRPIPSNPTFSTLPHLGRSFRPSSNLHLLLLWYYHHHPYCNSKQMQRSCSNSQPCFHPLTDFFLVVRASSPGHVETAVTRLLAAVSAAGSAGTGSLQKLAKNIYSFYIFSMFVCLHHILFMSTHSSPFIRSHTK
jgi:hypothetical protein